MASYDMVTGIDCAVLLRGDYLTNLGWSLTKSVGASRQTQAMCAVHAVQNVLRYTSKHIKRLKTRVDNPAPRLTPQACAAVGAPPHIFFSCFAASGWQEASTAVVRVDP